MVQLSEAAPFSTRMSKSSSYSKSRYGRSRYGRYRSPVVDRVNLFAFVRRSLRMFRCSRWWIVLVTLAIGSGSRSIWR